MSSVSPFRIDIIYQGVNVGTPTTVLALNDTVKLDQIGSLTFTIPTIDTLTQYLVSGTYFEIYDEIDGYLGRYLFKSKSISEVVGVSITTVECYDILKELTFETVGFNRSYESEPVSDVIDDLVSLYPGWTVLVENGLNDTTIDYQGESIYRAVDEQRDRNSAHFRLAGLRQLEFGYFGEVSEVVFTNLRGQHTPDFANNPYIAPITNIQISYESDDIYNKIIPLGFGQGVSQLTISEATLGDYDINTGTNQDGSLYYYIQDTESSDQYGTRTRILSLPNIRPLDNNTQNVINAANALKLTAESYLTRHLEPVSEYSLTVKALRKPLEVGSLVKVTYKGLANNHKYIDVDTYLYVMDITRNRSIDGNRDFSINVSTVDLRRTSDTDVIVEVVRDLKNLNVKIPATLAYSVVGTYVKRIRGDSVEADRISPVFKVRVKEEVLYLNRAILRFETSPLKSSVRTTASNVAQTSSSEGAHRHRIADFVGTGNVIDLAVTNIYSYAIDSAASGTIFLQHQRSGTETDHLYTQEESTPHSHTIPSHNHNMIYDVFENDVFPQNLKILIDSIDYTNTLLSQVGETNFAPTNSSYEYELDITNILINNGLKQNHTIEFYSETDCTGEIEFEVNMLVTIQPIRID